MADVMEFCEAQMVGKVDDVLRESDRLAGTAWVAAEVPVTIAALAI